MSKFSPDIEEQEIPNGNKPRRQANIVLGFISSILEEIQR
jgi:hypothetical protein